MIDPNQIHILFAPIMAAYGLAFLTVVWNRIGLETNHPLVTQGHLVIVAVISAIPLIDRRLGPWNDTHLQPCRQGHEWQ